MNRGDGEKRRQTTEKGEKTVEGFRDVHDSMVFVGFARYPLVRHGGGEGEKEGAETRKVMRDEVPLV
ncbi:MAG: hypothetical protein SWH78_16200 [Thermodesulfobacteriota bacterium]|nr:hypothetical protein [Thermodesulfobacteriota bacterium]